MLLVTILPLINKPLSSVVLLDLDGRGLAIYLCVVHLGSTGQLFSSGSADMCKTCKIQPPWNLTPCGFGTWRIIYHLKTMVFVSRYVWCQLLLLFQWREGLCIVLVEESVLSLQRIFTSVTQVLASALYRQVQTQPTHLCTVYSCRVLHLDPTLSSRQVFTFGPDLPEKLNCECIHLEPTRQKCVLHLDPTH